MCRIAKPRSGKPFSFLVTQWKTCGIKADRKHLHLPSYVLSYASSVEYIGVHLARFRQRTMKQKYCSKGENKYLKFSTTFY